MAVRITIIALIMLVSLPARANDLVCIEENEDSLPIFWAQLRDNIKNSPSMALERWLFDLAPIGGNNPCEFWMIPVSYEEAGIIYHFTSQFDGFFSTPLIYHYDWHGRQ